MPLYLLVCQCRRPEVQDCMGRNFQAGHVVSCEEKGSTDGKNLVIVGAVVRQTSVNEAPVQLKIYLTEERNIREAICSCPAGESGMCMFLLLYTTATVQQRRAEQSSHNDGANLLSKLRGNRSMRKEREQNFFSKIRKVGRLKTFSPYRFRSLTLFHSSIFAKILKTEQTSAADRNVISDVSKILEDTITLVDQASLGEIVRNCLSLKHPIGSTIDSLLQQ